MKKKKKGLNQRKELHAIRISAIRNQQVEQGIFDGRYRTKTVLSKKVYKRSKFRLKLLS